MTCLQVLHVDILMSHIGMAGWLPWPGRLGRVIQRDRRSPLVVFASCGTMPGVTYPSLWDPPFPPVKCKCWTKNQWLSTFCDHNPHEERWSASQPSAWLVFRYLHIWQRLCKRKKKKTLTLTTCYAFSYFQFHWRKNRNKAQSSSILFKTLLVRTRIDFAPTDGLWSTDRLISKILSDDGLVMRWLNFF